MSKTLVIAWGELRAYPITQQDFVNNLLKPLNADLALCLDLDIKKDKEYTNNLFYTNAKYDWSIKRDKSRGWNQFYQQVQNYYKANNDWEYFVKATGKEGRFLGGIFDSYHYGKCASRWYIHWLALQKIKELNLLNKYSWFILTRTDLMWKIPQFNLDNIEPDKIHVAHAHHHGGLSDRHLIIPAKHLTLMLSFIKMLVQNPMQLYYSLRKFGFDPDRQLLVEQILAYQILSNKLNESIRLYPYTFYTVRRESDPCYHGAGTGKVLGKKTKAGYWIKYLPEFRHFNFYKNLITSTADWHNYLNGYFPVPPRGADHEVDIKRFPGLFERQGLVEKSKSKKRKPKKSKRLKRDANKKFTKKRR